MHYMLFFFNNLTNYLYFYNKKCYCPCNEFVPPCTKQLRICKGKRELNRHYLERGLKESEREKCSKIVFDWGVCSSIDTEFSLYNSVWNILHLLKLYTHIHLNIINCHSNPYHYFGSWLTVRLARTLDLCSYLYLDNLDVGYHWIFQES